jgi:hypothetical protein
MGSHGPAIYREELLPAGASVDGITHDGAEARMFDARSDVADAAILILAF